MVGAEEFSTGQPAKGGRAGSLNARQLSKLGPMNLSSKSENFASPMVEEETMANGTTSSRKRLRDVNLKTEEPTPENQAMSEKLITKKQRCNKPDNEEEHRTAENKEAGNLELRNTAEKWSEDDPEVIGTKQELKCVEKKITKHSEDVSEARKEILDVQGEIRHIKSLLDKARDASVKMTRSEFTFDEYRCKVKKVQKLGLQEKFSLRESQIKKLELELALMENKDDPMLKEKTKVAKQLVMQQVEKLTGIKIQFDNLRILLKDARVNFKNSAIDYAKIEHQIALEGWDIRSYLEHLERKLDRIVSEENKLLRWIDNLQSERKLKLQKLLYYRTHEKPSRVDSVFEFANSLEFPSLENRQIFIRQLRLKKPPEPKCSICGNTMGDKCWVCRYYMCRTRVCYECSVENKLPSVDTSSNSIFS